IDAVITDWDSYLDYGRKLKEQNVFLIADAGDVANVIINTTVKEGEGLYFDEDGNSLITSERFVNAFETAKTIREEGLDGQIGAWSNEWYDAFKTGTVATQLSGAWLLGHLQNWMAPDTAGLWGASNLPDGIYGSWGGGFLAIPKQVENKHAAWDFIKYLTTDPDPQLSALATIGAFPVLTSTYTDASFDEPLPFLDGQPARQLFAEVAQRVPAVVPMDGDLIAKDVVGGALQEVLNDGKDVMSALKDAERLVLRRTR
ncbi:extracellular solute-binding protein, partial [Planktotalea sp.]|uniref:extracellular solute-binding protein n=1 Tax=Planktotalea sp. TaxID=2029877 RepID=UPI003296B4D9